jgi:hypothetical protein
METEMEMETAIDLIRRFGRIYRTRQHFRRCVLVEYSKVKERERETVVRERYRERERD